MTLAYDYDEDRGEYFSRPATEFDGCDPGDESQGDAVTIRGIDYYRLDRVDVLQLPADSLVYVAEVTTTRTYGGGVGIVQPYKVGLRNGKKVLYSLPYASSYLGITGSKKKMYLRKKV